MPAIDVRETLASTTLVPTTTPAVPVAGLNFSYLLRKLPVQQVGTVHFATLTVPPFSPVLFPEVVGEPTDICRGLPQGATNDVLLGLTLPAPPL